MFWKRFVNITSAPLLGYPSSSLSFPLRPFPTQLRQFGSLCRSAKFFHVLINGILTSSSTSLSISLAIRICIPGTDEAQAAGAAGVSAITPWATTAESHALSQPLRSSLAKKNTPIPITIGYGTTRPTGHLWRVVTQQSG
jgi:hypothetical protein